MKAKISGLVICIEAIMYLLLLYIIYMTVPLISRFLMFSKCKKGEQ